jgi:hypothetical protein
MTNPIGLLEYLTSHLRWTLVESNRTQPQISLLSWHLVEQIAFKHIHFERKLPCSEHIDIVSTSISGTTSR